MNRRILSLLLTVAMLFTALVMAVPASAESATEPLPLKTKGYQLRVHASTTANGQSTVYLLEDGTFIIFDGGGSATDAKHLSEQLHSIAAQHGLSKVVVSLWIFTHPHGDHMGFLSSWSSYKNNVAVEQIWYNPADWVTDSDKNGIDDYSDKLESLYPDTPVKAVHAGEEYDFANVHIKVLWGADETNEQYYEVGTYGTADYVDLYGTLKSGTTSRADQNNASTIVKMTVYGTSILMGGDAGYEPFESIYRNDYQSVGVTRNDLDCDIFQMTHHGVGSASKSTSDKLSTPNNKHFAVMTPDTIIVPAGLNVVNMVLKGTRALTGKVTQNWEGAPKSSDYDGYYGMMLDFGVVDAAKEYDGTAGFADEAEFSMYQSGTTEDGKTYYLAGWLNPDNYEGTKGKQLFFEAEDIDFTPTTEMLAGAAVRCIPDGASGLRFLSNVPAATIQHAEKLVADGKIKSYSFGTVIFKASSLHMLSGNVSAEALEAAGEQYVDITAKNGIRDNSDGSKTISAALVNIKEKNYGRSFAAVSYIEYQVSSGYAVRTYAQFDSTDNVRSIAQVARAALADVSETQKTDVQDGVYYIYKYLITDPTDEFYGKYSLYTEAQRAVLRKYAQANDDTLAGFDRDDVGTDIWD